MSGGDEEVSNGGTASQSVLRDYSKETLLSGGHAFGTVISASGVELVNGGTSSRSWIVNQGVQLVSAGTAYASIIGAGGLRLGQEALVNGSIVEDGGTSELGFGATARNADIESGGEQLLLSAGISYGTKISAGGVQEVAFCSATPGGGTLLSVASGSVVYLAGLQIVELDAQAALSEAATGGRSSPFPAAPQFPR